ncbi:MAG TPA: 4-hydroxy-tetrahydrodipicolinate reductase [Edaphocola sp.]|nr:4-hydroxy-tetrahydrodipicolinate reductase [Edaphocola sp.]
MDIVLIGYGKMGKAIEQIALERGHQIVLKISRDNQGAFTESNLQMADVAIEFTSPGSAFENVEKCLAAHIPVVCGTTGWDEHLDMAKARCIEENGSFLQTANFSVGVNLFFELNRQLAAMMNNYPGYDVHITETHHLEKKDKPSGTAITLAEQVLDNLERKKHWHLGADQSDYDILNIQSFREAGIPGTHLVRYTSGIDDIEIRHTAHSRKGFALGAVLAAEYIHNKKGVFSMRDVLKGQEKF